MIRSILILLGFALLIGLSAIGLTSDETRFASVNHFKTMHTESATDPIVLRRARRHQDTVEWHAQVCKEDPQGYDCRISAEMLHNEESGKQYVGPRQLSKLKM